MRRLAIFLIFALSLYAYEYNRLLLQTQTSLYPKIILMDKKLSRHLRDNSIKFYILTNEIDRMTAEYIKEELGKKYGNRIGDYNFVPKIVNFSTFLSDKEFDPVAIYILKEDKKILKSVAKKIEKRNIYSFTYEKNDLLYGFLCNITIEEQVVIYINKKVLLQNDFDFSNTLYQMAKFVE